MYKLQTKSWMKKNLILQNLLNLTYFGLREASLSLLNVQPDVKLQLKNYFQKKIIYKTFCDEKKF